MRGFVMTLLGLLVATPAAGQAPQWAVDQEESRIGFVGRQNGNEVRGHFERFDAAIRFAPDDLDASSIRVEVDMSSAVVEGGGEREEILSGSAWFNVEDFPEAVFTAEAFEPAGEGYRALGTLTMKGVEREVPLTFTVDIEGDRAVAEGEAEIVRTEFSVGPDGALFGVRVATEVDVLFRIEATRAE